MSVYCTTRLRPLTCHGALRSLSASLSTSALDCDSSSTNVAPPPATCTASIKVSQGTHAKLSSKPLRPRHANSFKDNVPGLALAPSPGDARVDLTNIAATCSPRAASHSMTLRPPTQTLIPSTRPASKRRCSLSSFMSIPSRRLSSSLSRAVVPSVLRVGHSPEALVSSSSSALFLTSLITLSSMDENISAYASPPVPPICRSRLPLLAPLFIPPSVSSHSCSPVPESPLAHSRRSSQAPMCLRTSPSEYKFMAHLREGLSPEMVTVYAKRGCRLAIVVDAWHLEQDSHHEWEIAFTPQDVDMASIRAHLESDGQLNVTVQRRREADPENISPPMFL